MSNDMLNKDTCDPIAIEFILKKLSVSYPNSFHQQATKNGYDKPKRMNEIETAAVLCEVGVGDKK